MSLHGYGTSEGGDMTTRRAVVCVALCSILGATAASGISAAAGDSLRDRRDRVRWTGSAGGAAVVPQACLHDAVGCDEFTLRVALRDGFWSRRGAVQIAIKWEDESQDLDLYVFGPDGDEVASSAGPVSTAESVNIDNASNGDYRVVVVPSGAEETEYEGVADIERYNRRRPVRYLRPDLVSLPARNPQIATSAYLFDLPVPSLPTGCYPEETLEQGALRCLRFDQIIANVGDGTFELRYMIDDVAGDRRLLQRVYRSDGSFRDFDSGSYVLHPTHAHFHYTGFATSKLWRATPGGDRIGSAPIAAGRKNGFCMIDVENVWFGRKGDAPRTYIPPSCLAPTEIDPGAARAAAVNGISVGWADVYNWFLPDQFIEISGVPDGYYLLETIADPDDTIVEKRQENNASEVLIRLCGDRAEIVGGTSAC